jgi:hypothetical protein
MPWLGTLKPLAGIILCVSRSGPNSGQPLRGTGGVTGKSFQLSKLNSILDCLHGRIQRIDLQPGLPP